MHKLVVVDITPHTVKHNPPVELMPVINEDGIEDPEACWRVQCGDIDLSLPTSPGFDILKAHLTPDLPASAGLHQLPLNPDVFERVLDWCDIVT